MPDAHGRDQTISGRLAPLRSRLLGIAIGEYWVLDDLAEDCARDGSCAFLLVSVPLNLRGAIVSPPQAIAIT